MKSIDKPMPTVRITELKPLFPTTTSMKEFAASIRSFSSNTIRFVLDVKQRAIYAQSSKLDESHRKKLGDPVILARLELLDTPQFQDIVQVCDVQEQPVFASFFFNYREQFSFYDHNDREIPRNRIKQALSDHWKASHQLSRFPPMEDRFKWAIDTFQIGRAISPIKKMLIEMSPFHGFAKRVIELRLEVPEELPNCFAINIANWSVIEEKIENEFLKNFSEVAGCSISDLRIERTNSTKNIS